MERKEIVVIAGPNGAGKTTFALTYLRAASWLWTRASKSPGDEVLGGIPPRLEARE